MFVELHILQNFAPANLNRDDTGAPKDCIFGGFRRARISSQCIKRVTRQHPAFRLAVAAAQGDVGIRTKRLLNEIADGLTGMNRPPEDALRVAESVLKGARMKVKDDQKTEYLLYLGRNEIAELVRVADKHWDALAALNPEPPADETEKKKTGAKAKRAQQETIPQEVVKETAGVFAPAYAADIALFGRMVADDKNKNVNAACQVAHAISTNEVQMEMDYYTAIDDLLPEEDTGSDMIGTVEFNSSTFYRYALVNLDILRENLKNDDALTKAAVLGFLEASVLAIPTGKQHSMAAQNPPSYVRVLVRSNGAPWSLANAFLQPVRPGRNDGEDIVTKSVTGLEDHLSRLKKMYGGDGIGLDLSASMIEGRENLSVSELLAAVGAHLDGKENGL